jgi:hypothetical protein
MAEFLRAAWGAAPSLQVESALVDVPNGVVHHIGGGDAYPSDVVTTLRMIQAMEQHGGYVDIAYNWGADQNGNIWELRGDVRDGATLGYAGTSFSVLAICNAAAPNFIVQQGLLSGIAAAFRAAQTRGVLARDAYIDSHHWFDAHVTNAPTACCGAPLIAKIPTIRSLVTGTPPTPSPAPVTEDDMIRIVSPTWKPGQKWRGAIFDLANRTITQVGVHLTPNEPPQKMTPPNNNPWFDAQRTPIGVTLFTNDYDPYDYTMSDL